MVQQCCTQRQPSTLLSSARPSALLLSQKAAPAFDWVIDQLKAPGAKLIGAYLLLALSCFAATAIGLEAALGAFAGGLIVSTSKHREEIQTAVTPIVALFATVFFVLVGAGMDLSVINPADPASRSALRPCMRTCCWKYWTPGTRWGVGQKVPSVPFWPLIQTVE